METKSEYQKKEALRLTKGLTIQQLIGLGFKAKAQNLQDLLLISAGILFISGATIYSIVF